MKSIYSYMDIDEPRLEPIANVPHPTKDKSVGLVGNIPERDHERGYVSHRRREGPEKGFFEKGEGYCISDTILRKLMRYDVKFVYIAESDTGDVHEYNINSFIKGDAYDEGEPQHCAPIDTAVRKWEGLEPDLIVE